MVTRTARAASQNGVRIDFAQLVNSYKRLWGGAEAPSYVCWGSNNRSALVRVPIHKPGKGQSTRVEYRAMDPAVNPYLAFAVLLAAGLKGIEGGYELPDGAEDDVWELSASERRAMGYEPLPASLADAIAVMEKSELVAETLAARPPRRTAGARNGRLGRTVRVRRPCLLGVFADGSLQHQLRVCRIDGRRLRLRHPATR